MLNDFISWLDAEVETLENTKDEEELFILGKYFEAVRIRAKFLNLIEKTGKPPKDSEILDMLNELWKKRIDERANHD